MPKSPSVWDDADALLAQPAATSTPNTPSVWDEADAVLSTLPAVARPKPFAAAGVTDPASVKVDGVPTWDALRTQLREPQMTTGDATLDDALRRQAPDSELEAIMRGAALKEPPAAALPTPPTPDAVRRAAGSRALMGATQGGEAILGQTPPLGSVPILDAPAIGIPKAIAGARAMIPTAAGGTGKTSGDVLHGANDVLEGLMQTAEPAIAAGAIVNPVSTAGGLFRAWVVQQVGEAGAEQLGASPEGQRLVGNLAAVLSGSLSANEFAIKAAEDAKRFGRAMTLAAKLSGSGFGPGDVPAFRGAPFADEIASTPADVPASAGSLALEEQLRGRPAARTPDVWKDADALLKAPPATEAPVVDAADLEALAPTRADLVRRTIEEGRAAGVPANDTARRLEQDRQAVAAGALTDSTKHEIDTLLQEVPTDAVPKPEADAGRVRGIAGPGDEAPSEAVGVGDTAPVVVAGPGGATESAAAAQPATGDRAATEAVAAQPTAPQVIPPDLAATLDTLKPAAPASARVEGATDEAATVARAGDQSPDGLAQRVDAAGPPRAVPEGSDLAGTGGSGRQEDVAQRAERLARRRAERADYAAAVDADHQRQIADAVDRAVAEGFTGDRRRLHTEIHDRVQLVRDLDQEFAQSDRNPQRLLREVARLGGLSIKAEAGGTRGLQRGDGMQGEIKWLRQFADTNLGHVAGVAGVFNEKRGQSLDNLVTALRQGGEFNHIASPSDLIEELAAAAREGRPHDDANGDRALARALESLGPRWWDDVGHAPDVVHEEGSDSVEPADHELDAAAFVFDPAALEAQGMNAEGDRIRPATEKHDVLDTGEHQARLPDAGAVRDTDHATPAFDAPFSLTGDTADTRGRQDSLLAPEKPIFGQTPQGKTTGRKGTRTGGSGAMVIPPASKPSAPVTGKASTGILHSEVLPGADKFVERDVIPHVKKIADELLKVRADVHAVWAPDTTSEPAETQAALMRAELGARRQRTARAQKMMRAFETAWDKIPRGTKDDQPAAGTQLAFAMAVDEGRVDELPEWQRGVARLFKEINDKKRDEIVAWKGLRNWLEHYYPREWVKPGKVAEFVRRAAFGKRPLQGRASFRKARARDDAGNIIPFRAYLQAGYEPVEPNPVRAHLRKWMEMDKWLAARKILERGKSYGTAEFVPIGKEKPDGYDFYDESFGTVYGPPTVQVHEAYDALLMQGLNELIASLDVKHERTVRIGGGAWGLAYGDSKIKTKFGGAETVLEHELGHILDTRYGLRKSIIDVKDKRFRQELRDLADLREEGTPAKTLPPSRLRYLRKGQEKIANLVHAFLYNPERTKQIAPNSYWALYNLAKEHAELRPLLKLQQTKSLKLESATADVRIHGLPPVIGRYAGPPDAVRLLNRALSPGLRGFKAFNLFRGVGNLLNQVQLGLSGFHLVGTALNAGLSHGAIALEHATRGNWRDAAGHAGLSALGPLASLRDVIKGHALLRDYYAKDANFRTLVDVADGVARGGGAVTWDTFWHESAPARFLQALRSVGAEAQAGNYPGAAARAAVLPWRAMTAAIEAQAKPIMEWWVPRLKLAAYWDLYRMELADLGEIPDELELQKAAGRAWRSVDNRFGELVYDNLFWHAALKDAGMATVRSLGWNVGTIDEVFGALPAQARQLGALPAAGGGFEPPKRLRHTGFKVDEASGERMPVYEQGRAPALTHKFAYVIALAFYSALFGAIYQYLHTGLAPGEQEDGSRELSTALLDFYFPRTGGVTFDGRPERASLPTYVKDVYAFLRHPIDTSRGKLNPLLSLASDVIANSDYFGNALRDPQAPWLQQVRDTFDYVAHEYRPISVSSYFERQKNRKGGAISLAESFLGINVAPASVTRTALENYLRELQPPRTRTKEEADRAAAKRSVRELIAEGKKPEAKQAARDAGLTGRGVQQMARAQRLSSLQRAFQATSLSDAIRGYELATPEERKQIKRILERKAANAQSIPPAKRDDIRTRLRAALTLPVEGK